MRAGPAPSQVHKHFLPGFSRQVQIKDHELRAPLLSLIGIVDELKRLFAVVQDVKAGCKRMETDSVSDELDVGPVVFNNDDADGGLRAVLVNPGL